MPKQQHQRKKSNPGSSNRSGSDQGIVRERGEEQPRDKERALHVSRQDKGDDPPGHRPPNKMPQR